MYIHSSLHLCDRGITQAYDCAHTYKSTWQTSVLAFLDFMCFVLQKKITFDYSSSVCHDDDSHLSSCAATWLGTEAELLIT